MTAPRTPWRFYCWWGSSIVVLIALAVFCWAVVVPVGRVGNAAKAVDNGSIDMAQAFNSLGGRKGAPAKLRIYLAMPDWVAGRKTTAIRILRDHKLPADEVTDVVGKSADDHNSEVRTAALTTLTSTGDPAHVDLYIAKLGDESASVRTRAARSLGTMRARRAVQPLCVALTDKDEWVRLAAARSLGLVGSKKAVSALCTALSKEKIESVQTAMARSLGQLGDPSAGNVLFAVATPSDKVRFSKYYTSHMIARLALGKLRDPRALSLLVSMLEYSTVEPVVEAAGALADLGDMRAVPYLEKKSKHWNKRVSKAAKDALAKLRRKRSITPTGSKVDS